MDAELQRIEDHCLLFPDCISYEQVAPLFSEIRKLKQMEDERDDWKKRAEWWELKKCTEGVSVRDLFVLGEKYLPESVALDLGLASTTPAWFIRLAHWIEESA